MNHLVRLLFLSLVSSTIALPAPEPADPHPDADVANPKSTFHDYIHHIDENSVQQALQLFDKFRHGVSHPDAEASPEDSDASTVARMNLIRRNAANSSAAVEPTQTTTAPTSTQAPPESSASESSSSSSASSSSSQEDTTTGGSTVPPTTTASTTSASSSQTSASTGPAPSQPASTSSSSSSSTSQTHSTATSTTSTEQSTTATTHAPRTSTFKSTTTLPNGQQSTVTEVTVVHPTQTTSPSHTGPAPGLQTDSAAATASFARELWLMVGGAALVAMAL
ncbi:hypothetical protein BDV59DRAFT_175463 [Aspergillus ambiguus]|uniref:putative GPI anchored cell wall protein (Dan4) n=1 Tax=Aspergillus ambiguus TaxID=176160 RepID=UPI003CCCD4A9